MARKKLQRFAENQEFSHVVEPSRKEVVNGLELRGKWKTGFFKNDNPIILELGCGKGEYTVAMAQRFPDHNFVGVDIKGARIWYGASEIHKKGLTNAGFLRTQIELIDQCFAPGEVSEIWITFPDPQIKHKRAKHRLTNPAMLRRYQDILHKEGLVHLKTDSEFLHGYTIGLLEILGHPILEAWYDIDHQVMNRKNLLHEVSTHYEQLFRDKGKAISYLRFSFREENGN
ncbi:MAG TPA: tRNA (guanosine(46)-N7)-methyltransferase TrmB [Cryomorphaceae bacterium]|nr:tRNA (guanosine(46)-N7)-methyltransferase TrmB [Owenweeksia sp.]MBF99836.1 tRNA (guanosine(46)-N7)-methyltransferase TrmB [Owenweeksia sp.]HAD98116.1 tRNA (guanosine(46)-N7)-methyltransferase TrmB [Cryomorphaceae bacterium]HBF21018.1 tRNA (guanosine(46)-N7)-methyltransferase TrmB [Cryomorphaceae bacterium]HCQ16912.1 tRNA (guanosine(46)-N7)-methyltransferase TrmB [Cryomorphaceae bacterium]|tara:strand:+ start:438 stop:1124 length:687 start_codon:yes stop_codon:yes gene_type:complete